MLALRNLASSKQTSCPSSSSPWVPVTMHILLASSPIPSGAILFFTTLSSSSTGSFIETTFSIIRSPSPGLHQGVGLLHRDPAPVEHPPVDAAVVVVPAVRNLDVSPSNR